ncbi:Uncharacterised protein [Salmonella enterica subsp. enterica]|uniref:Uncharacterized protein n=1 Tax=Salmonella enterica I TaxID=59201 RepID=A0A379Y1V5_SALET|nr:Uncharacterised protein [Salmonella enterica subsp. enterica]
MKTKMKKPKTALKNAMKDEEPACVQIQMRATVTRKSRYKAHAIQEDLNLTEWMANHLDAVCDAAEGNASVGSFSPVVPEKIPDSVYQVIYQECGGFVDCDANAQTIWNACRQAILNSVKD